ncbi:MAG: alpha/beta fold hydrolase [Candidatus Hydrogenedentes bacterium]|nr:alpha/beta fold hydrolase [Candidatus Hydrogenedentota bacterium]
MEDLRVHTIDGFDLAAVVTRGRTDDVIIWMHGISVDKDEYLGFFREGALWFANRGPSSIRFDFRGHGASSGTPLDFTVVGQNLDVRAILDLARRQFGAGARLHIVAASFGSPPAIFAGHRYPKVVLSVSLIAPVLSYERTFLVPETEWAKAIFSKDQLDQLDQTGRLYFDESFYIGHHLVEEMRLINPVGALTQLKQRVLVVHGDRDSMVPYDATHTACRGLEHVRLVTLKGADHGFVEPDDEEGRLPGSVANKERILRLVEEHLQC